MSENESSYGWWISTNIKSKKEEDNRLYKRRNIKYPGDLDTKIKRKEFGGYISPYNIIEDIYSQEGCFSEIRCQQKHVHA